jgi:hypothetical protein
LSRYRLIKLLLCPIAAAPAADPAAVSAAAPAQEKITEGRKKLRKTKMIRREEGRTKIKREEI